MAKFGLAKGRRVVLIHNVLMNSALILFPLY